MDAARSGGPTVESLPPSSPVIEGGDDSADDEAPVWIGRTRLPSQHQEPKGKGAADGEASEGEEEEPEVLRVSPPIASRFNGASTHGSSTGRGEEEWDVEAPAHLFTPSSSSARASSSESEVAVSHRAAATAAPSSSYHGESDDDTLLLMVAAGHSSGGFRQEEEEGVSSCTDLSADFGAWLLEQGVAFAVSHRATNEIEAMLGHVITTPAACRASEVRRALEQRAEEVRGLRPAQDVFYRAAIGLFSHFLAQPRGTTDMGGGGLAVQSLLDILQQRPSSSGPAAGSRAGSAKPGDKKKARKRSRDGDDVSTGGGSGDDVAGQGGVVVRGLEDESEDSGEDERDESGSEEEGEEGEDGEGEEAEEDRGEDEEEEDERECKREPKKAEGSSR